MKWRFSALSTLVVAAVACAALVAQGSPVPAVQGGSAASSASDSQGAVPEEFMLKGKIAKVQAIGMGVTGARKVTLEFNGATHDAVFKSIEVYQPGFTAFPRGGGEVNFEDSWKSEIAAYQVDRIIGLGRVPATVERSVTGERGSLQWWVDSMMPEIDRIQKKINPPDGERWNREAANVRLFHNLIYNTDNHMNNVLLAHDWTPILIDHSRSFRAFNTLQTPKEFTRFSRSLLDGITKLEKNDLSKRLGKYLRSDQITALLKRRDLILALAKEVVAARGEQAVLFP